MSSPSKEESGVSEGLERHGLDLYLRPEMMRWRTPSNWRERAGWNFMSTPRMEL